MDSQTALKELEHIGAVLRGHFVGTSGVHLDTYVNKDVVYWRPQLLQKMCGQIATRFRGHVEVVVGPEKGGILLSQWVGWWLGSWNERDFWCQEVLAVYAEKEGNGFAFKRGSEPLLMGKKVGIVEDVLTTGGSVRKVVEAVGKAGGIVTHVGAICNRGNVKDSDFGITPPSQPPHLYSLIQLNLPSWSPEECPLCQQGIPINTDVGKGREFVNKKSD